MELLELTQKTFELFKASTIEELSSALMAAVISNDTDLYDAWLALIEDPSTDWLQRIYQYHAADRKEHKQDFTPKSLAAAVNRLTNASKSCLDLCAGSGALTIQKWATDHSVRFVCLELDTRVIPFLLFNIACRGIEAIVVRGDALSMEFAEAWKISDHRCQSIPPQSVNLLADSCISNPPFNIKWDPPPFAQLDNRFAYHGVPPKSNANFAFILTALQCAQRCVFILPSAVLSPSSDAEQLILRSIAEENLIDAVILCPDSMFESTTIGTCILVLDNAKATASIEFVDLRSHYETEVRDQNGQYGGASHTRRTYHKNVKVLSEQKLDQLCECIGCRTVHKGLSACASIEDVRQNGYDLRPSTYIGFETIEQKHREYADIVSDLNRVIRQRNACKLIINETVGRSFGLNKDIMGTSSNPDPAGIVEKLSGQRILKDDYIQFTKNKGELTFKANDPDILPSILQMIMATWKQHMHFLNNEENRYLAELRDALLPDLMSGKIDITEEEHHE